MNTRATVTCALWLLLGVSGGSAGMYFWFQAREEHGIAAPGDQREGDGHSDAEHGQKAGAGDHEDHGSEGESHEEEGIVLSAEVRAQMGVEVAEAAGGRLEQMLALPGEIALNADRVAHIVPRVGGIVREVRKYLGEEVQPGEVMAIIESRELAEAKGTYLAGKERLSLAQATFKTSEDLKAKKILPELDFLNASKQLAEAEIELRVAENKLHAIGLSQQGTAELTNEPGKLTLYELRGPFTGTVIAKHCALGEVVNDQTDAFMLADLSTVWANITVYAQDVGQVRVGQTVHIQIAGDGAKATGTIAYIASVLSETTRSALARVDLPNTQRQWRPGTFITAAIVLNSAEVPVLVPLDAIQRLKNQTVVFIAEEGSEEGNIVFQPRPVVVGRTSPTHADIVSGLRPGERFAVKGASILKADLGKREAVHEH